MRLRNTLAALLSARALRPSPARRPPRAVRGAAGGGGDDLKAALADAEAAHEAAYGVGTRPQFDTRGGAADVALPVAALDPPRGVVRGRCVPWKEAGNSTEGSMQEASAIRVARVNGSSLKQRAA